jgi:hypothetical protein
MRNDFKMIVFNVTIRAKYKKLNYNKRILKNVISLHFVKMHPNFHLSYDILVRKYNVTITIKKRTRKSIKISFCFQTRDKNVLT